MKFVGDVEIQVTIDYKFSYCSSSGVAPLSNVTSSSSDLCKFDDWRAGRTTRYLQVLRVALWGVPLSKLQYFRNFTAIE